MLYEVITDGGVKEIQVIAQDLSFYGYDLYKDYKLPQLVEGLANIDGLEWIRLHYAYPAGFPMDVLKVMNEHPNVCNRITSYNVCYTKLLRIIF